MQKETKQKHNDEYKNNMQNIMFKNILKHKHIEYDVL